MYCWVSWTHLRCVNRVLCAHTEPWMNGPCRCSAGQAWGSRAHHWAGQTAPAQAPRCPMGLTWCAMQPSQLCGATRLRTQV